jgi:maltose/moltooligosaccharide transporter
MDSTQGRSSSGIRQGKESSGGVTHGPAGPAHAYRCGSLTYTRKGLVFLFAWLLWGDLCFTLMETVVPSILPLKLRSLDSSNLVIGLLMSTLPGVFNTTICPWVSFKSDRHRGRWGRRMPFIVSTMPFLTAALILIGFSDSIGDWLYRVFDHGAPFTRTMVTIGCLAVFAGVFDLFNMFVNSVYWYLFNDVVPQHHLARFMAYFRIVATAGGAFYNFFVFKHALSHMREIYCGAALLYVVGFGLMCLKVKEGQYPPPEDAGRKPNLLRDIRAFARECYTMPYYWNLFLSTTFGAVGACMGMYGVFFSQSLGLHLDQIGKINAANSVLIALSLMFVGSLVDRWHPVRMYMYASIWSALTVFNSLIWLLADTPSAGVLFGVSVCGLLATAPFGAVVGAAGAPREMILFPKDRFGQFCGAQSLVRSVGTMLGGGFSGLFLDFVRRHYEHGSLFPYRYIYIWIGGFTCLGAFFNYRAYRAWKRLGGEESYVPPVARFRYADLSPASHLPPAPKGPLVVFGIMFFGGLLVNLFWTVYFRYVVHHQANAILFGSLSVLMGLEFWVFLRFVRLAERP